MRLTVKAEDEVVARLGRLATDTGKVFDDLVTDALRDYLEKHPPSPMPKRVV